MARTRITFVGFEPFWMEHATRELARRYGEEFDCRWLEWPSDNRGRIRLLWESLRSRMVVRMGMPFDFESQSNWWWLQACRIAFWVRPVNYWIGHDVMDFLHRRAAGELTERDRTAVARLSHITVTEHLAEELRGAGLRARNAELMGTEYNIKGMSPLPRHFAVLGYWSAARFEYLGGPQFYEAARAMPETEFFVLGTDGAGSPPAPANVSFLGRLEDPVPAYERTVVLVRQIQHDSVPSGMIEEMLLLGRYVIYTYAWPFTITVPYGDAAALVRELTLLRDRFEADALPLNADGREFTVVDCDPERRAASMKAAFTEILEGRL